MATLKQRKLARKIIENLGTEKPQTLGEVLAECGYSRNVQKNPQEALKGKGIIELFKEAGITGDSLARSYNELLSLPLKDNFVSADTRRKTLQDLANLILKSPETKLSPQIQFIGKFFNLNALAKSRLLNNSGDNNDEKEIPSQAEEAIVKEET